MGEIKEHNLTHLHWELSVLSRAVPYQNLSAAAMQIGISQPQLSRIISKIETELKVSLLDRSARRKSGWTPIALQLAETYQKSERRLDHEIKELVSGTEPAQIRVGTLEGFSALSLQVCHSLLQKSTIKLVEIDIHDLDELEKSFLKGDLDLIFTLREPSRRKYRYEKRLGYQTIDWIENDLKTLVISTFEHHSKQYRKWNIEPERVLVSNSLEIRKAWLKKFGGAGTMPSESLTEKPMKQNDESVYVIGSDQLSQKLWSAIEKFNFKLSK